MINKKELRIGNFVEYSGENLEITDINQDFPSINTITIDYLDYEEIYPIPLTEEWLIKFGFEFINDRKQYGWYLEVSKNRNLTWCHSEYVSLEFGKEDYDYNNTLFDFNCKHVHQLQNLYFALTNEEL